jgi:hypothetical protein
MASSSNENRIQTLATFLSNFKAILTSLIFLSVLIAALDSADKASFVSSFPVLEKALGRSVETLGCFSLFTNLSYALSLSFWGWVVHCFTQDNAHYSLLKSCCPWGLANLRIASSNTVWARALFRSIHRAAQASILPMSQMIHAELVPSDR